MAAIVAYAQADDKLLVQVDPEPLPQSLDGTGEVLTRAGVVSGESDHFISDLYQTAARSLPAAEREHCAAMVSDDDPDRAAKLSGCPKKRYKLLVIGSPRRDFAAKAAARSGDPASDTRRWVRVLEKWMYPSGPGNLAVADYEIERKGERWQVVVRVERIHFDAF